MSKDFWNNEKDKIFDVLRKASVDRALAKILSCRLLMTALLLMVWKKLKT